MYRIDLGNGTILENLTLNGNNFVSTEKLTEDVFEGMGTVTITNDEDDSVQELNNVILVALSEFPDGFYFVLRKMTEEEMKQAQLEAQIFFTALATDSLMGDDEDE